MKMWQIVILMMIIIRFIVFMSFYFTYLRKLKCKGYTDYYTKTEWIRVIVAIALFTETTFILILLLTLGQLGLLALKLEDLMSKAIKQIAEKIYKKLFFKDKK